MLGKKKDNTKISVYSDPVENYAKHTRISNISLSRERDKVLSMPKPMLTFGKSKITCVFFLTKPSAAWIVEVKTSPQE